MLLERLHQNFFGHLQPLIEIEQRLALITPAAVLFRVT